MIKGKVTLDFCDALTGKVKDRIEGNNTFTNAMDSLLNRCPMGADRATMDGTVQAKEPIVNFTQTALGGVLLFPYEVEAGANVFYEPLTKRINVGTEQEEVVSQIPTAYSRYGAQDTQDSRSGTFNILDSRELENGFRFVHEWGASYGNGKIKSVCLTNIYGAEAYASKSYFGDKCYLYISDGSNWENTRALGFADDYYYYITAQNGFDNGTKIARIKRPLHEMFITQKYMNRSNEETIYTNSTNDTLVGMSESDKKIYIITGSSGTTRTLTEIDLTTSPVSVSTSTMTVPSDAFLPRDNDYFLLVKRGSYLYGIKSFNYTTGEITISKININLNSDYSEISGTIAGSQAARYCDIYLMTDTNEINGGAFIIDTEDNLHVVTPQSSGGARYLLNRFGVWQGIRTRGDTGIGSKAIGWQINPYYMATKFNLQETATKNSSLTMRLVYEVTHV